MKATINQVIRHHGSGQSHEKAEYVNATVLELDTLVQKNPEIGKIVLTFNFDKFRVEASSQMTTLGCVQNRLSTKRYDFPISPIHSYGTYQETLEAINDDLIACKKAKTDKQIRKSTTGNKKQTRKSSNKKQDTQDTQDSESNTIVKQDTIIRGIFTLLFMDATQVCLLILLKKNLFSISNPEAFLTPLPQ